MTLNFTRSLFCSPASVGWKNSGDQSLLHRKWLYKDGRRDSSSNVGQRWLMRVKFSPKMVSDILGSSSNTAVCLSVIFSDKFGFNELFSASTNHRLTRQLQGHLGLIFVQREEVATWRPSLFTVTGWNTDNGWSSKLTNHFGSSSDVRKRPSRCVLPLPGCAG